MLLVNVFIKKLIKKAKNTKSIPSISAVLFLRLTCNLTLIQARVFTYIQLLNIFNITPQFNMNYSITCDMTFHLSSFIYMTIQKILNQMAKSHKCNQIEVLLQRDFRFKNLNKKKLKY